MTHNIKTYGCSPGLGGAHKAKGRRDLQGCIIQNSIFAITISMTCTNWYVNGITTVRVYGLRVICKANLPILRFNV